MTLTAETRRRFHHQGNVCIRSNMFLQHSLSHPRPAHPACSLQQLDACGLHARESHPALVRTLHQFIDCALVRPFELSFDSSICREYGHVWHFLRTFNLPYCSLYEQGYTSLGKQSLTRPNPALRRKYIDDSGALAVREVDSYWPAYMVCVHVCICFSLLK